MDKRDILYSFAVAQPIPTKELLDEWVRLYPEYTQDLLDLAVELILTCEDEHLVVRCVRGIFEGDHDR